MLFGLYRSENVLREIFKNNEKYEYVLQETIRMTLISLHAI